jgi:hypothetical protein
MDYRDLMFAVVSNSNIGFGAEAGGLLDMEREQSSLRLSSTNLLFTFFGCCAFSSFSPLFPTLIPVPTDPHPVSNPEHAVQIQMTGHRTHVASVIREAFKLLSDRAHLG